MFGTVRIQVMVSGMAELINPPNGIWPSIMIMALTNRTVAWIFFIRKARKDAEAIKKAIRENMLACKGAIELLNIQINGLPLVIPAVSTGEGVSQLMIVGKNPAIRLMKTPRKTTRLNPQPVVLFFTF